MASKNQINLIGRVVADPEQRFTQQGKAVTTFKLAVDRKGGDRDNKKTDFFTCIAWEKLAEICGQYLSKGKLISVTGSMEQRDYTKDDGTKVYVWEVKACEMEMLSVKEQN